MSGAWPVAIAKPTISALRSSMRTGSRARRETRDRESGTGDAAVGYGDVGPPIVAVMGPKPGSNADDFDVTIGCLVGFAMGLVGAVVGTVVLLLLRPTWIAREGDAIGTIRRGTRHRLGGGHRGGDPRRRHARGPDVGA